MLYRNILITHLLCFILCMDQCIVQILTDKHLPSLYFRTLIQKLFYSVNKQRTLNAHLFQQF